MAQVRNLPEFDHHELVEEIEDKETGLHGFIAIHRPGPFSLGATRLWKYASEEDALRDVLRLSRLMSYKSAISGMKYGGAKAVLMLPEGGVRDRRRFFEAYAEQVNRLKGRFITGTDVGVTDGDIAIMKEKTPYVIGSKVDPARYTAIGVVEGIKVSLEQVFGSPEIGGRTFAVQGTGKVGSNVIRLICNDAKKIFVTDINEEKLGALTKEFPMVIAVSPDAIYEQDVDVFVPCALSGVLNERTIPRLRCRIVAGSANNQLAKEGGETKSAGMLLHDSDILYAPDYIINTGGFISVVDEFENGEPDQERILGKIHNMQKVLGMIFRKAAKDNMAIDEVADRVAETLMPSFAKAETIPVVIA